MAKSLFINPHHVAIVVRDMNKTANYYQSLGMGPFVTAPPIKIIERTDRGKLTTPGSSKIKEVIGNMGVIRLQLIQPIEGKSMFQEFLDTRGEGVHHYAFLVDDIEKEEAKELIQNRRESISPYLQEDTQTDYGCLFEILADLTDEDGALAELQDLERVSKWVLGDPEADPGPEPEYETAPTGENLLDLASQEKLPPLYSGEDQGLDALAQVKFFTPDAQWTWYASEYDGEDIFFGLVIELEIELGYFSLSELKSVKGPMGLLIERDLHFEPKSLKELMEKHKRDRGE